MNNNVEVASEIASIGRGVDQPVKDAGSNPASYIFALEVNSE